MNQFDVPLNPEFAKILEVKKELTPEQLKVYDDIKKSKVCREAELTPALRQLIQEILDVGSYAIPDQAPYSSSCLGQFAGSHAEALLVSLDEDFKVNPEQARDNLEKFVRVLTRLSTDDNTLIARIIGLTSLATKALPFAVAKAKQYPRLNFHSIVTPDLIALSNRDPSEILVQARNSELRLTRTLLEDSYRSRDSLSLDGEADSKQSQPLVKFLWLAYQPHRTLNLMFDRWQYALAEDRACFASKNCSGESLNYSLTPKDYFINPMGNSLANLLAPRLNKISTKITLKQEEIRKNLADLKDVK